MISSSDGYLSLYSFQGEAYAGGKFLKASSILHLV